MIKYFSRVLMDLKINLLTIIAVFFSCNTQENKQNAYQKINKTGLQNLSFESTTVSSNADTFKVDNRIFKINKGSDSKDITITYFENNKWNKNVAISVYDQFETTIDFNHDGYNDIYSQAQGWNYINYYLPKQKLFSKQFQMPGDNEIVIDSSKGLYANYREPYNQCNSYRSQLIDYSKAIPTVHFLLEGETINVNGQCIMDSIKDFKLYRYDEVKDILILLKSFRPKSNKKFDYEDYWKKNYQKLMGYK